MKKQSWPKIRATKNHGKTAFMVDSRIAGKGERKFFPNKTEAETWAQLQRVRRENEGGNAFDDRQLARFGWTIHDAVRFALDHLERQEASKPVAEAVAALQNFKRSRVAADRLADISNRLRRFTEACGGKTVAHVTPDDINEFLATIPHPTTRNDYRKEIVMLWRYCRARKWVTESFDNTQVPRDEEPDKARVILSVDQAARLMEASHDPDICALNAMVLFGGLRREEVEKLDWKAVDFRTGHINVSADVSKVSRERFAPMPENLRAWLEPLAEKKGSIVSRVLMHALRVTWKRAGLYPWPQDAHRHSFISYRRKTVGDATTAMEAGTSETIIKRHYQRPVTAEDAARYFEIRPSDAAG